MVVKTKAKRTAARMVVKTKAKPMAAAAAVVSAIVKRWWGHVRSLRAARPSVAAVDTGTPGPGKKHAVHPPSVVFVTGPPGSGKTHAMHRAVLKSHERTTFARRWQLNKFGKNPQLIFHTSADGRIAVAGELLVGAVRTSMCNHPRVGRAIPPVLMCAHKPVAGGYVFGDEERWGVRRSTEPVLGGVDTLQPQSKGLLAALLRGDMAAIGDGSVPAVVIVESCSVAKMGGSGVLDALLGARQLICLELTRPREDAIDAVTARGRVGKGKTASVVHDDFARQVVAIRAALEARAEATGLGGGLCVEACLVARCGKGVGGVCAGLVSTVARGGGQTEQSSA